jgi:predicted NAD/FAD-dependent oxidoreductase
MSKTYREQFDEAMRCQTKEEANAWMAREIEEYKTQHGKDAAEAEYIIKSNLGYMAGYCDHKAAQKVQRLFGAVHPVFGTADYHQTMTPEEAFETGKRVGESLKSQG